MLQKAQGVFWGPGGGGSSRKGGGNPEQRASRKEALGPRLVGMAGTGCLNRQLKQMLRQPDIKWPRWRGLGGGRGTGERRRDRSLQRGALSVWTEGEAERTQA